MEKIKVLHMFREFEIGGIQSLLINLYENMDYRKIQFDYLLNDKGILDKDVKKSGSKIYYISYIKKVGPIKYKKELKEFLLHHKEYKILHLHFDQFNGLIAKVASECGVKVIISHSHIINNTTSLIGKIYKRYLSNYLKYATDYFACSEEAAKYLYGKNYSNAIIINNGIDFNKFKFNKNIRIDLRSKLGIKDDIFVIGHTGRFSKEKNQLFLVELFYKYLKNNKNSLLVLIGDGFEMKNVLAKVNEYKIAKNVLFLGSKKDIYRYYNIFDIFIFPSLFEGLGISLLEAQCNGLPCVSSSNVPKVVKITDNVSFLKLEEYNKWINKIEEYRKKNINRNIILKNNKYDIKIVAKNLYEFYEEAYRR